MQVHKKIVQNQHYHKTVFFSRIHKRIAHLCIKKKNISSYNAGRSHAMEPSTLAITYNKTTQEAADNYGLLAKETI